MKVRTSLTKSGVFAEANALGHKKAQTRSELFYDKYLQININYTDHLFIRLPAIFSINHLMLPDKNVS